MSNAAEGYESYMVPTLFAPWAEHLIEGADVKTGQRVLDLGCGTGIVARQVAARLGDKGSVVGIDRSANMLAVADTTAARDGLKVEWREGRAEALPFADASFDRVLSQFALMFFDDRPRALAEVHRVLAPGGGLSLNVWQGIDRHPFYRTLDRLIERKLGVGALESMFALGEPGVLRELLTQAGFRHVEIEPVSITSRFPNPEMFLAGEIEVDTAAIPAMQGLTAADREAMVAAISEEMQEPLKQVTRDNHVVIEFHANVARAWR
jgi:ubiquinone/menaquinone biosynthesis C-methylase UbiE